MNTVGNDSISFPGKIENEQILYQTRHFQSNNLILILFITLTLIYLLGFYFNSNSNITIDQKQTFIYNIIITTIWLLSSKILLLTYVKNIATKLIITNERVLYIKFNILEYQIDMFPINTIAVCKFKPINNLIIVNNEGLNLVIKNIINAQFTAKVLNNLIAKNFGHAPYNLQEINFKEESLAFYESWIGLKEGKFSAPKRY